MLAQAMWRERDTPDFLVLSTRCSAVDCFFAGHVTVGVYVAGRFRGQPPDLFWVGPVDAETFRLPDG